MRKTLFALLLPLACCLSSVAWSQGNLQFNQVIIQQMTSNVALNFTVPAGKVWKIEAASGDPTNSFDIYLRNSSNQIIARLNTTSSSTSTTHLPYWLPSGYSGNFFFSTFGTVRGSVSIIEFNVVP